MAGIFTKRIWQPYLQHVGGERQTQSFGQSMDVDSKALAEKCACGIDTYSLGRMQGVVNPPKFWTAISKPANNGNDDKRPINYDGN